MIVAIFAGLYYTYCSSLIGYTLQKCMKQPIIIALFFGVLMGNIKDAMIIGAALEMCYVGVMAPGGTMPADEALAAVISIPLALSTGADTGTAVLLAAPLAVLGGIIDPLRKIWNSRVAIVADKCCGACDQKGLTRCAWLYGVFINFVLRFPIVFIAVYFGRSVVRPALDALPGWITHGMSVTGGLLPALGFALILFTIGKPSIFAFFFLGFLACEYMGLNVLSAAFFGIAIAVAIMYLSNDDEKNILNKVKALKVGADDDDDED
jgi:D-glucosaminate-specific PTS system IIC component